VEAREKAEREAVQEAKQQRRKELRRQARKREAEEALTLDQLLALSVHQAAVK